MTGLRMRIIRACWVLVATMSLALAGVGIWAFLSLTGSLPVLSGSVLLGGLSAPVTIDRDSLGIPTIRGANRVDVARATGFLHGQERFFQMDLLRRSAAGELAELVGAGAVELDLAARVHQFRARARAAVDALPKASRILIEAYAAGVNAGLLELSAPPIEYLVLRASATAWRPEDTFLTIYAMYLDLQRVQWWRESTYGTMHDVLPQPLFAFLAPRGTDWETPVRGASRPSPSVPGPEIVNLRTLDSDIFQPWSGERPQFSDSDMVLGSNAWAVAGDHTRHRAALLANDMHLTIQVPNIWYRASLAYPDLTGNERRITGVTLPGVPAIVIGSNGRIAWGFTNSEGDWSDLVNLDTDSDNGNNYLTPQGYRPFEVRSEIIKVDGSPDQALDVASTVWGPVIDHDHTGRPRALRWVAHDPAAVNLEAMRLEDAGTIEEALTLAARVGMPAQNLVVGDADGHIGWTVIGPIPRRFGHDGRLPSSWADGSRGWDGYLDAHEYPRIVDPPSGRIWTANARVVDGEALDRLGDGGYALGVRARQIRDGLLEIPRASELDMLELQLDDRGLFLERWRRLLLDVLTPESLRGEPRRQELRDHVLHWGGHAAVDSVGYRVIREFRTALADQIFWPLISICRRADPTFDYGRVVQQEGPLWRLVSDRPMHLLQPRYRDWQEQFLEVIDTLLDEVLADGTTRLADYTWGKRNTSHVEHPLSPFIPGVGHWLNMSPRQLPGDSWTPRAQTPHAGASERMVVAPGHETDGIMEMPVGQSGHPLSPHYRDSHEAWARGEATSFLPGDTLNTLVLVPADPGSREPAE